MEEEERGSMWTSKGKRIERKSQGTELNVAFSKLSDLMTQRTVIFVGTLGSMEEALTTSDDGRGHSGGPGFAPTLSAEECISYIIKS